MCLLYLEIKIDCFKLLKYHLLIIFPNTICIYYNNNNNKNRNDNKTENNNNDSKIN